jgi:hypothetical protein
MGSTAETPNNKFIWCEPEPRKQAQVCASFVRAKGNLLTETYEH